MVKSQEVAPYLKQKSQPILVIVVAAYEASHTRCPYHLQTQQNTSHGQTQGIPLLHKHKKAGIKLLKLFKITELKVLVN